MKKIKHKSNKDIDKMILQIREGFKNPKNNFEPFSAGEFKSIVQEILEMHTMKDHDYAGSKYLQNLTASSRLGVPAWKGTLIRMQDKMSRLENFSIQEELKVKDESVEDTLKDLAVYSILCLILYRNKK